jgi:hypothetical protein
MKRFFMAGPWASGSGSKSFATDMLILRLGNLKRASCAGRHAFAHDAARRNGAVRNSVLPGA